MGRKQLPQDQRKDKFSLRIRKELIDKLRKIDNYNSLIERLIEDYLRDK